MAGEELVAKYQTIIFLAGSASAEFFADMALSPFEAVKVRADEQVAARRWRRLRLMSLSQLHACSGVSSRSTPSG